MATDDVARAPSAIALVALALCCCLPACRPAEEAAPLTGTWPAPDGSLVITGLDDGDLIAVELETGKKLWRYHHIAAAYPSVIELPRPRLVCPPAYAVPHVAYLLFSDWVVAVSLDDGAISWRKPIRTPSTGDMCPAATPDSGVVLLARRGSALVKLRLDGELDWSFHFPDGAIARAGPTVHQPSGDILVRAGPRVFGFHPGGALAWSRPLR